MMFVSGFCVLIVPFIFLDGVFAEKMAKAVFEEMHQSEAKARSGAKIYATKQQEENSSSLIIAFLFKLRLPFPRSI